MFERDVKTLVGKLLLRKESCDTIQGFRDRIFPIDKQQIDSMIRANLDTHELFTSFGYSSLPFVWNTLISKSYEVRNVDELWRYVWANHLENSSVSWEHTGDYPENLTYEQEFVIRDIISSWENNIKKVFSTNKMSLCTLAAVPHKDYLIVGLGRMPLEESQHPFTKHLSESSEMLISKTSGYTNRETGELLTIYNFIIPNGFKKILESYTELRSGTTYMLTSINEEAINKLLRSQDLVKAESALSVKNVSFVDVQKIHQNVLNYAK